MARLPKNDKVVDIGTIAAALGVSKTTVSRAISGNGRVGAATRQRVQDYVKEHNYTPRRDGTRAGDALLVQHFAGDLQAVL